MGTPIKTTHSLLSHTYCITLHEPSTSHPASTLSPIRVPQPHRNMYGTPGLWLYTHVPSSKSTPLVHHVCVNIVTYYSMLQRIVNLWQYHTQKSVELVLHKIVRNSSIYSDYVVYTLIHHSMFSQWWNKIRLIVTPTLLPQSHQSLNDPTPMEAPPPNHRGTILSTTISRYFIQPTINLTLTKDTTREMNDILTTTHITLGDA